ncbi:MAG TPA: GldG family protein, partial [Burkholderiaceae bacterium]|nr:GldG family protein [Burkholderiaceae bacterium]
MTKTIASARGIFFIGVLFVGITLLANTLLRNFKLDLTADHVYTISDGTKNIIKSLKEPVNLYLFFSERTSTPNPDLKNYGARVRDFLDELAARSDGKIIVKVIDPQPFSEEEDRANELGISGEPVAPGGDRLYLGLAGTNSTDGKEAIPYLDFHQDEQLEYDVAKLIYKLSNVKKPVIAWLSTLPMQGDMNMQTGRPNPPWVVYGQLEQLYTVRNLEPTLTSIDADVDELVLVHPKELPPAALYAIDQFAMRGGHVLAFVDPLAQADQSGNDPNNPMAQFQADKASHLEPLLKSWGIDFNPGEVVGDLERGLVIPVRENEPPTQHIAILGMDASSFGKDPITNRVANVNIVMAGSLKPVKGSKLKFEPLMHTSTQAGVLPAQRLLIPSDPASLRDGFKPTG